MRVRIHWMLVLGLTCGAGPACADSDLAQRKNCLACHTLDKRKYGPNFQEIAAKYADRKNADEILAAKIRRGGSGVWGRDIMPPQPQVSAADARTLARYILSVK